MKNRKNILVICLLLLITAVIVMLPMINVADQKMLGIKQKFIYNPSVETKLTNTQVAKIICETARFGGMSVVDDGFNRDACIEKTSAVLGMLFDQRPKLIFYFDKLMQSEISINGKYTLAAVEDNRPVTLAVTAISFASKEAEFEICYEEKSSTIISFRYICNLAVEEMDQYVPSYHDMYVAVNDYYTNIGVNENGYYFNQLENQYSIIFGLNYDYVIEQDDVIKEEDIQ